jgi:glutaredoxin 2
MIANIPLNKRKKRLQSFYFDEKLYQRRNLIERAFAQMDAFKALLIRFETSARNWLSFNNIAIFVIAINKLC